MAGLVKFRVIVRRTDTRIEAGTPPVAGAYRKEYTYFVPTRDGGNLREFTNTFWWLDVREGSINWLLDLIQAEGHRMIVGVEDFPLNEDGTSIEHFMSVQVYDGYNE